jgi:hypothetical protein
VYDALTETLRFVSWLLLAMGLTVALTAALAGVYARRRRPAEAPRQIPAEQSTHVGA